MNRLATVATIVGLLAAGAFIVGTAPDEDEVVEPFAIAGEFGEPVVSPNYEITITDVRLATTITADYALTPLEARTSGTWVVVDAEVLPIANGFTFSYAELRIGEYSYRVSDLVPSSSLTSYLYQPGVPVRGSFAFEVPASALELARNAGASVVFSERVAPILESEPVIPLDLGGATIVAEIALDEAATLDPASTEGAE